MENIIDNISNNISNNISEIKTNESSFNIITLILLFILGFLIIKLNPFIIYEIKNYLNINK
tara:strand:- start:549 stop:731 length:183 start_codon:yes stop_codon:yes gene_type:complete